MGDDKDTDGRGGDKPPRVWLPHAKAVELVRKRLRLGPAHGPDEERALLLGMLPPPDQPLGDPADGVAARFRPALLRQRHPERAGVHAGPWDREGRARLARRARTLARRHRLPPPPGEGYGWAPEGLACWLPSVELALGGEPAAPGQRIEGPWWVASETEWHRGGLEAALADPAPDPAAAPDAPRAAGAISRPRTKPTIPRAELKAEMRRRKEAGRLLPTKTAEAEELSEWSAKAHPSRPHAAATIRADKEIGAEYARLVGQTP